MAAGTALILLTACADKSDLPRELAGADPDRGLRLIQARGCASCHAVPGVRWPEGQVGGSLAGVGARPLIAGELPNQPDVMVAFLRDPPALQPGVAMPPTPLRDEDLRDIAAYLYTLDDD